MIESASRGRLAVYFQPLSLELDASRRNFQPSKPALLDKC